MSNYEIEQFQKTIPSLSQSPEGRKRVIANLEYLANAKVAHRDSIREILKENKNIPPYELEILADEKTSKKMDSLYKKFKQDLERPVPAPSKDKATMAFEAIAGSVIGAPKSILSAIAGRLGGG